MGLILEQKPLGESDNMEYYEAMAEAIKNLQSERQNLDMSSQKQLNVMLSTETIPVSKGDFSHEVQNLYSNNKSLYNSSKLFPPTERDLGMVSANINSFKSNLKEINLHTSAENFQSFKFGSQNQSRIKTKFEKSNVKVCFRMFFIFEKLLFDKSFL